MEKCPKLSKYENKTKKKKKKKQDKKRGKKSIPRAFIVKYMGVAIMLLLYQSTEGRTDIL